jgi:cytidyltransferase-like protein
VIVKFKDLPSIRQKHSHQSIVLAGGVFDLLHPGHLDLLKKMRKEGGITVIAITSDKRVRERKGSHRPIHDQTTRLVILDAIKYVDYVLIAPAPSKSAQYVPTVRIIRKLRPDIFFSSEKSWYKYESQLIEVGTRLKVIKRFSSKVSTSKTINKVLSNHK